METATEVRKSKKRQPATEQQRLMQFVAFLIMKLIIQIVNTLLFYFDEFFPCTRALRFSAAAAVYYAR